MRFQWKRNSKKGKNFCIFSGARRLRANGPFNFVAQCAAAMPRLTEGQRVTLWLLLQSPSSKARGWLVGEIPPCAGFVFVPRRRQTISSRRWLTSSFSPAELPPDGLGFVPSCLPTDRRKKKEKKTPLASPQAYSNCAAVSSSYSCPLTEGLTSQTRCLLPLMSYLAAAAQSSRGLEGAPEPLPIDKSLAWQWGEGWKLCSAWLPIT